MNEQENKKRLKYGFKLAKKITGRFAKTFYFVSWLLTREKRNAAYSVYAVCRISDDSVDDSKENSKSKRIGQLKNILDRIYRHDILDNELFLSFQKTVHKYNIPKEYFDELLEGMQMDLEKNRYSNFAELYNYCYKVAGVVGLIMIKILGYRNIEIEKYAIDLGVAMQLTNILRDIEEDFNRGRIYLPQDELTHYNVSETSLAEAKLNDNLRQFLKFQIRRARGYYRTCEPGIKMTTTANSRLLIYAIKYLYAAILNEIESNDFDIFSKRPHVNLFKKIGIILKILIRGKYL